MTAVLVIAKEPVAGRVKTRLCPPCRPEEAALIADAALADTLSAVRRSRVARRILVIEGDASRYRSGFEVILQCEGDLAGRLSDAFERCGGSALLIGMDTPQVTPSMIEAAVAELERPDRDAVLGPTLDGGYWAIGLKAPNAAVFHDIPMSSSITFGRQMDRLRDLGMRTAELPLLRDVDLFKDALAVADEIPYSGFTHCVRGVTAVMEPA